LSPDTLPTPQAIGTAIGGSTTISKAAPIDFLRKKAWAKNRLFVIATLIAVVLAIASPIATVAKLRRLQISFPLLVELPSTESNNPPDSRELYPSRTTDKMSTASIRMVVSLAVLDAISRLH
jgi:hypothetical protein